MENQATEINKKDNLEWGLLLGAAIVVDLIQIGLNAILVGAVLNRLIDFFVGLSLFAYCLLRGIKLTPARSLSILLAFIGELIPAIDIAPLWSADVFYIMMSVKAEEGSKIAGLVSTLARPSKLAPGQAPIGAKPPIIGGANGSALPPASKSGSYLKSPESPTKAPPGSKPPVIQSRIQPKPPVIEPEVEPRFHSLQRSLPPVYNPSSNTQRGSSLNNVKPATLEQRGRLSDAEKPPVIKQNESNPPIIKPPVIKPPIINQDENVPPVIKPPVINPKRA